VVVSGRLPLTQKAQRAINNAIVKSRAAGLANVPSNLVAAAVIESDPGILCDTLCRAGADLPALKRALESSDETEA
jgi:hypothetical protein